MPHKRILNIPLNRVEGDLEIRVELEDGHVADAWSSGTMFRGFEQILVGRGALDGLVIAPRICGICSTAHLTAASRALDHLAGATVLPDAVRVRNVALMAEHIQSDMRHTFLMFTADFVNAAYRKQPLYAEAVRRYTPFAGETVREVIQETKRILEVVAIVGGQWPHSSYMVPGGLASALSEAGLAQCRLLLKHYIHWFEQRILGCSLHRWSAVHTAADLEAWLDESRKHRDSDLGFFIRYARAIGLHKLGRGHDNFLSYGYLDLPEGTAVKGFGKGGLLVPAGFARGVKVSAFDPARISEHVAHSWFVDYPGGKHPFQGQTQPYASGSEGGKYSWAKAPRYMDLPAETGPLAEMIMCRNGLFRDLVQKDGANVFVRQLARIVRPVLLMPAMEAWLEEARGDSRFYSSPGAITNGQGYGLTHAARGALGHWVKIADGKITHYQIITPTTWHASPRDANDVRGSIEQGLVGAPLPDPDNPVELGHVIRSFDPCLVCTVHSLSRGRTLRRLTLET
jgi:hydrogenase large subunit